jgi:hypothetical protein
MSIFGGNLTLLFVRFNGVLTIRLTPNGVGHKKKVQRAFRWGLQIEKHGPVFRS